MSGALPAGPGDWQGGKQLLLGNKIPETENIPPAADKTRAMSVLLPHGGPTSSLAVPLTHQFETTAAAGVVPVNPCSQLSRWHCHHAAERAGGRMKAAQTPSNYPQWPIQFAGDSEKAAAILTLPTPCRKKLGRKALKMSLCGGCVCCGRCCWCCRSCPSLPASLPWSSLCQEVGSHSGRGRVRHGFVSVRWKWGFSHLADATWTVGLTAGKC